MGRRKISDLVPFVDPDTIEEGLVKQLLAAFVINLVALLQGASVSSSSIVLHSLQENLDCHNSTTGSPLLLFDFYLDLGFEFSISEEDGSWVASTWVLAHLIFAPIAGFLTDKIGRKKALMIDTGFFFVGFTILTTASSLPLIILARLLLGCPIVSQVYLCEVVSPARRGLAAAMYSVLHSTGFCMMLLLGAVVHWRVAMAVPAFLALPTMAALYFLRESPSWLQRRGRQEEAEGAAAFYKLQLTEVLQEAPSTKELEVKKGGVMEKLKTVLRSLSLQGSQFWHNFAFLAILFVLIGWCGFSILSFYAVEIFQLSGAPISASHASWITSCTKVVCAVSSFYFLHRFSRKSVLLTTAALICLSFLTVGIYSLLTNHGVISVELAASLNFIPMAMVIVAYIGYGLGFGVIPSLLAAESMPVNIRSTVVGIFMALEMSSTFLLSKLKPMLIEQLGIEGLFLMFSGILVLVILLTHTFLKSPIPVKTSLQDLTKPSSHLPQV